MKSLTLAAILAVSAGVASAGSLHINGPLNYIGTPIGFNGEYSPLNNVIHVGYYDNTNITTDKITVQLPDSGYQLSEWLDIDIGEGSYVLDATAVSVNFNGDLRLSKYNNALRTGPASWVTLKVWKHTENGWIETFNFLK